MYDLPQLKFPKPGFKKGYFKKLSKSRFNWVAVIIIAALVGFLSGIISSGYLYLHFKSYFDRLDITIPSIIEKSSQDLKEYIPQTSQEQAIINAVKQYSPAVVNIVISKDVPVMEQYFYNPFGEDSPFDIQVPGYRQKGTEKQEVGGGTGFIVSGEGLIVTNKHVVLEKDADYTVFTNEGKKYSAKVLAKDPVQDLAFLEIKSQDNKQFPTVNLGDSDFLQIGQTVIAIGNALGEFRNTVSVGVISGLGRTVSASNGTTFTETLEDIIQTDAAINRGNSGGPLLNLKGEVIGINTAVAELAQSIGFAIPVNKLKRDIEQLKTSNKITYAFLGVRYLLVNEDIQEKNKLQVDYGAWITKGENGEVAITKDSAAYRAGIKEGDIILEMAGKKIIEENSLAKMISQYSPGDKVILKILRDSKEMDIEVILGEREE